MIRPLEVYNEEENKRARFSLVIDTSPNDLSSKNNFSSIQVLNLNECDQYTHTIQNDDVTCCGRRSDGVNFSVLTKDLLDGELDNYSTKNLNELSSGSSSDIEKRNVTNKQNQCKKTGQIIPCNVLFNEDGLAGQNNIILSPPIKIKNEVNDNDLSTDMEHTDNNKMTFHQIKPHSKSSCSNLSCSDAVYCSSPSHRNRFYHFKSITKEQCNNVLDSLPLPASTENSMPSSNLSAPEQSNMGDTENSVLVNKSCHSPHNFERCMNYDKGPLMSSEVYKKQIPKSCMNGPTGVYPSPRRYPRTSQLQNANYKSDKCDTLKGTLPCLTWKTANMSGNPVLAKKIPSRILKSSSPHRHIEGYSDVVECQTIIKNDISSTSNVDKGITKSELKILTSINNHMNNSFQDMYNKSPPSNMSKDKSSLQNVMDKLPCKNATATDSNNISELMKSVADALETSNHYSTSVYSECKSSTLDSKEANKKKIIENSHSPLLNNKSHIEGDQQKWQTNKLDQKSENALSFDEQPEECKKNERSISMHKDENGAAENVSGQQSDDDFDFMSDYENDDLSYDEDEDSIDSDASDTDVSISRTSSFTSPSTSTDVFTPALSFGTSSSAALTEGFDSLSIQSSSEIDFFSYGSSLASPSEYDLPTNKSIKPLKLPLRPSLFPGIPPTIYFSVEGEPVMPLPSEIRHQLRWKLSTITPIIMKKTVTRAGISLTKSTTDWCGTWGKQVKVVNFKAIKSYQKVNHFPWTFQIGRKDKLWKNVWRMRIKHGHAGFHFLPQTYILPHDIKALKRAWENLNQKKPRVRHKWIIKPPASARGQGIKVIHKWSQIPKKWPLIVQKYLSNPYLINGSKFDLRLYVLVTSFDPLRIYVFDDGLVRFASVKYSANVRSLNDKFMHLTNYSINKKSSSYTANEDIHACQGHKWSLKSLWKYMQKEGIDTRVLWDNIVDIIIKTIISCESSVTNMMKRYVKTQFNCYELFGFDIMLDEKLKPWLLEVNISPSLHSNSPLDASIKGQLAKDLLNLAGFHVPNRLSESSKNSILTKFGFSAEKGPLCHDKKLYNSELTAEEKAKNIQYQQIYLSLGTTQISVLENLTPDDLRHLMLSEDELTRAGHFSRVYPSVHSHKYHKYFDQLRYYDMLLDAWEISYSNNRYEGVQRLQRLYRNHLDAEKKAETKITCKSTAKETKKTTNKRLAKTVKVIRQKWKQQKSSPYSRNQARKSPPKS